MHHDDLLEVLKRCRELIAASGDALYATDSVAELVAALDRGIHEITVGDMSKVQDLTILFAPTSYIQETSIANGWAEEYLSLAAKYDKPIALI